MNANGKKFNIHTSDMSRRSKKGRGRKRGQIIDKRIPYGAIANQVVNDGKRALMIINRFLNTEIHYNDVLADTQASSSTASFILLNGILQGDTTLLRTGSSIKCDGIDLSFTLFIGLVAVASQERVMVVMDKQPNGAIFAIGSLLNATTVRSPYVPEGQKRFSVLYDEAFALSSFSNVSTVTKAKIGISTHIEYNLGNAGTVADINSNSIYLIHFSNQAANTVTIDYYSRLWFIDN